MDDNITHAQIEIAWLRGHVVPACTCASVQAVQPRYKKVKRYQTPCTTAASRRIRTQARLRWLACERRCGASTMLLRRPVTARPCVAGHRQPSRAPKLVQASQRSLRVQAAAEDSASGSASSEAEAPAQAEAEPAPAQSRQEVRAVLNYERGSPSKFRRVLNVIRGKSYEEALSTLTFIPYRCGTHLARLTCAAAALAERTLASVAHELALQKCGVRRLHSRKLAAPLLPSRQSSTI